MKLGIVVLYWKNKSETIQLLNTLFSWSVVDATIVLVQNEVVEDAFPSIYKPNLIKIYSKDNLGFGGGNNLGIKEIFKQKSDFTLLLNTDIEIEEPVVLKMMQYLKSKKNVFSVGPVIIESGIKQDEKIYFGGQNIAKNVNTRIADNDLGIGKTELETGYTIGAVILLCNKHLTETGLFNTNYFFSGEVADLCYRAKKRGLKCITLLEVKACHVLEDKPLRNSLYKYYNFRNRFVFMRNHPKEKKYLLKWYVILLKELLYALITFDFTLLRTIWITLIDVLLRVSGNRNEKFIQ